MIWNKWVKHLDTHIFEMLGNFSFGDYFKKTCSLPGMFCLMFSNWMKTNYGSIYEKDDEAKYLEGGVRPENTKIGEKDNFWSMGDTGPVAVQRFIMIVIWRQSNGAHQDRSLCWIWNWCSSQLTEIPKEH